MNFLSTTLMTLVHCALVCSSSQLRISMYLLIRLRVATVSIVIVVAILLLFIVLLVIASVDGKGGGDGGGIAYARGVLCERAFAFAVLWWFLLHVGVLFLCNLFFS